MFEVLIKDDEGYVVTKKLFDTREEADAYVKELKENNKPLSEEDSREYLKELMKVNTVATRKAFIKNLRARILARSYPWKDYDKVGVEAKEVIKYLRRNDKVKDSIDDFDIKEVAIEDVNKLQNDAVELDDRYSKILAKRRGGRVDGWRY